MRLPRPSLHPGDRVFRAEATFVVRADELQALTHMTYDFHRWVANRGDIVNLSVSLPSQEEVEKLGLAAAPPEPEPQPPDGAGPEVKP